MQSVLIVSIILHCLGFVLLFSASIASFVKTVQAAATVKQALEARSQANKLIVENTVLRAGMKPDDFAEGVRKG